MRLYEPPFYPARNFRSSARIDAVSSSSRRTGSDTT
jgi:hypothetical protein